VGRVANVSVGLAPPPKTHLDTAGAANGSTSRHCEPSYQFLAGHSPCPYDVQRWTLWRRSRRPRGGPRPWPPAPMTVPCGSEPAACVLRGIRHARLPETALTGPSPGCVAILGGGSMGLLHLLVLKAIHPGLRVLVSDPLEERRELARTLGADAAVAPEAAQTE